MGWGGGGGYTEAFWRCASADGSLTNVRTLLLIDLVCRFNRYMNILPNNHTRVVLSQLGDDETSTYINANWMDGYGDKQDEFIACQGPLETTVHAFWRMVWETNAGVLVMNTGLEEKGVVKCAPYWPAVAVDGAGTLSVADFTVELVTSASIVPEYVETKLRVTKAGEGTRDITHLWWTEWPDKGVPKTANGIGEYINRTRAIAAASGGPVVIHCSAGIGRTGCFLAINYCMQQFDECGYVDIQNCVCRLRQMRGMTVQTESQYRWIHVVMQRSVASPPSAFALVYSRIPHVPVCRVSTALCLHAVMCCRTLPKHSSRVVCGRYMEGKLYEREADGHPGSPAIDLSADITTLKVRPNRDRPLSFQLGRKGSSRAHRRKADRSQRERKSSIEEEPDEAGPKSNSSSPVRADVRASPSGILVAGAAYTRGECLFNVRTFVRPTTCHVCESMLTGLALQGLRCSGCKRNICAVCLGSLKAGKCQKKVRRLFPIGFVWHLVSPPCLILDVLRYAGDSHLTANLCRPT